MRENVKVIEYRARRGAGFGHEKANVYGAELQSISERRGDLTASIVVEEARPESSPLHDRFEWVDSEAARRHREWQARHLMNRIEVIVELSGEQQKTRGFQQVFVDVETREPLSGPMARSAIKSARSGGTDQSKGSKYATVIEVIETPNYREQCLARARGELERWRTRYKHYEEFAEVVNAIDALGAV